MGQVKPCKSEIQSWKIQNCRSSKIAILTISDALKVIFDNFSLVKMHKFTK